MRIFQQNRFFDVFVKTNFSYQYTSTDIPSDVTDIYGCLNSAKFNIIFRGIFISSEMF